MRIAISVLLFHLATTHVLAAAQAWAPAPRLLLSTQRLKRLKRDRERQTARWQNFANRLENVPGSPERGFELALYYAITGDEAKGKAAVDWAATHPCEARQVSLIKAWCSDLAAHLGNATGCQAGDVNSIITLRDRFFRRAAAGEDTESQVQEDKAQVLRTLKGDFLDDPGQLYAAMEYLSAARSVERVDLREEDPKFFSSFPLNLILSLRPSSAEHPDWLIHLAALALVSLDPNMESSQFLQGWAIEDGQTIQEGPGVAYELLWADPYLPGVGYQNLDSWLYDKTRGRFVGRTNWSSHACWVKISNADVEQENCPPNWQEKISNFGRLSLIPVNGPCVQLPPRAGNENILLWKFKPNERITYNVGKEAQTVPTDLSGFWLVPANAHDKVCVAK